MARRFTIFDVREANDTIKRLEDQLELEVATRNARFDALGGVVRNMRLYADQLRGDTTSVHPEYAYMDTEGASTVTLEDILDAMANAVAIAAQTMPETTTTEGGATP